VDDPEEMAAAVERLIDDPGLAATRAAQGIARARDFRWDVTARKVYETYVHANRHRRS
jgi:glycosyltransferase involved in cell wall biosynthesis